MNKKVAIEKPQLYPIAVKSLWFQIEIDFVSPLSLSGNWTVLKFGYLACADKLPADDKPNDSV